MRAEYDFGTSVANPYGRAKDEEGSALKGQALTQGASSRLDACANRSSDGAMTTILSDEAFDCFCDILDASMPATTRGLLEKKPIWQ